MVENKEHRFKRIASKRTEKVLNELRKLGNCSNRSTYSYSTEDVKKVFNAIELELKRIRALYATTKSNKFTL